MEKRSRTEGRVKDIHEKDAGFFARSYEAARYAAEKCGWERLCCYTEGAEGPTLRSEEEIFDELLFRSGLVL